METIKEIEEQTCDNCRYGKDEYNTYGNCIDRIDNAKEEGGCWRRPYTEEESIDLTNCFDCPNITSRKWFYWRRFRFETSSYCKKYKKWLEYYDGDLLCKQCFLDKEAKII